MNTEQSYYEQIKKRYEELQHKRQLKQQQLLRNADNTVFAAIIRADVRYYEEQMSELFEQSINLSIHTPNIELTCQN